MLFRSENSNSQACLSLGEETTFSVFSFLYTLQVEAAGPEMWLRRQARPIQRDQLVPKQCTKT